MTGQAVTSGDNRVEIRAPGKINLGLTVLGSRPDGYHMLESLLCPIDLADDVLLEVTPSPRPHVELECDTTSYPDPTGGSLPETSENLAFQAAEALLARLDAPVAVGIGLVKRIPMAAGLGGGSSDAGAVLRGLARILSPPPGDSDLREIAVGLGADVPFFLEPRPALIRGIGEQVEPVDGLPAFWVVLANPQVAVATRRVFEVWDDLGSTLTSSQPRSTLRALTGLLACDLADREEWARRLSQLLWNDLQVPAAWLCPAIEELIIQLKQAGALAASMSGSGATVFGVFGNEKEAREAGNRIAHGGSVWVRVAVTESPG